MGQGGEVRRPNRDQTPKPVEKPLAIGTRNHYNARPLRKGMKFRSSANEPKAQGIPQRCEMRQDSTTPSFVGVESRSASDTSFMCP